MLLKGQKRLGFVLGLLIVLAAFWLVVYNGPYVPVPSRIEHWFHRVASESTNSETLQPHGPAPPSDPEGGSFTNADGAHREVFSVSTASGRYFPIRFGDQQAINPNIIPHPSLQDTWILVAQQQKSAVKNTVWFAELVCNAAFDNDTLSCIESPMILPIAATSGDKCEGDLAYFALNIGPHDARVFYGPRTPYVLYGSNSVFTCFGQWMQDLRVLVDWGFEMFVEEKFRKATELQRPPPYMAVEKNWFVFWDKHDQLYVHYDIAPTRVFAKLEYDGSVGLNLAPSAALADERCMAQLMPKKAPELESIHQATNSLSITLCRRADPLCEVNDSNTFIFTIFQHKSFYSFHSVYEPYVMLFGREVPFQVYAVSQKPIWIHGRQRLGSNPTSDFVKADHVSEEQSEMFYVTSMNWKSIGQKYHGYLDDTLLIAFGIEDQKAAGIDVIAADLLQDLGFCSAS